MTVNQDHAILAYIKTAVLTKHEEDYPDCDSRLRGINRTLVFPQEFYELGLSGALMHDALGRFNEAKASAALAIQALDTDSPFTRGEKVYGKAFATEAELKFLTSISRSAGVEKVVDFCD